MHPEFFGYPFFVRGPIMSPTKQDLISITTDRRKLAQSSLAGLSAVALAQMAPAAASSRASQWAFFRSQNTDAIPESVDDYVAAALTESEYAVLRAATGRIIPTDDLGPGAIEAGASIYIDRALGGRASGSLETFQAGLAALDSAAGGFADAAEADQDAALTSLEAGEVADAPEGFFATLLEFTRQGMFSDPIHGGNREFIGWDLINYPGIKLVWTAEDQALDTVVEPEHISVEKFGGVSL